MDTSRFIANQGRLSRNLYLLYVGIGLIVNITAFLVIFVFVEDVILLTALVLLWIMTSAVVDAIMAIKRLHDLGYSGSKYISLLFTFGNTLHYEMLFKKWIESHDQYDYE
jgi:uncharacterized membrane protein YhaH (DUF805 family)